MRITSRGVGLLAAAALLSLTGVRFGYTELTLLGVAGLVALGCAAGHALWQPRLLVRRVAEPDRVGRGEPARMTLTVRNQGRLRVADLVAEDRCGRQRVLVPLLRLRPGRDSTVSYPVPTERRGVIPVGPLRASGGDALGLLAVARSYGGTAQVWVHPRVHPLRAVPAGVTRSLDGRLDRVPQGSVTFDSLREYVVGDELRRVHWRTSARVGELMVREQLDTSQPRLVVLVDNRVTAHPQPVDGVVETFESACEVAASVLVAARREELPVLLTLVVDEPVDAGTPLDDLDRLAAVGLGTREASGADDPLHVALSRLRQQRLGDTLIFLTGSGGRADLGQLGMLHGAYPVVLAGVFGATGQPLPGTANLLVIEAEDGAAFAAEWDGTTRW